MGSVAKPFKAAFVSVIIRIGGQKVMHITRGKHGQHDDTFDELDHERLQKVILLKAAKSLGEPLESLALHALGVRVVSLRKQDDPLSI